MKQRQRRNIMVPTGAYYVFDNQGNLLSIAFNKEEVDKKIKEIKKGESPVQQKVK